MGAIDGKGVGESTAVDADGTTTGVVEGAIVGADVGSAVGDAVGMSVQDVLWDEVVGSVVGDSDGSFVGNAVGESKVTAVGDIEPVGSVAGPKPLSDGHATSQLQLHVHCELWREQGECRMSVECLGRE